MSSPVIFLSAAICELTDSNGNAQNITQRTHFFCGPVSILVLNYLLSQQSFL